MCENFIRYCRFRIAHSLITGGRVMVTFYWWGAFFFYIFKSEYIRGKTLIKHFARNVETNVEAFSGGVVSGLFKSLLLKIRWSHNDIYKIEERVV